MKHTLIIFALLTATIQTFAQSPRIKLNQITKDSLSGSVLISSPTDSGMVYSRDLFISYGVSDTFLILGGDTLAKTSGIISSVLSDGVTIVGDGTTGSELRADTSVLATLKALSDSLALVISSVTADNVTITGDGTIGSPLKVDTTTYIATKGDLDAKQNQLNGTGFVKATGTTISYDNSTYLTTEVDGSVSNELQTISTTGAAGNITLSDGGGTLNLNVNDADADATNEGSLTVETGTASTSVISSNTSGSTDVTLTAGTNVTLSESGNNITIAATGGGTTYNNISETVDTVFISGDLNVDANTLRVDATTNRVGIGTSSPLAKLSIKGGIAMTDPTVGFGSNTADNPLIYVYDDSQTTSGATNAEFSFQVAGQGSTSTSDGPLFAMRGKSFDRFPDARGRVEFYAASSITSPSGDDGVILFQTNGGSLKLEYDGDVVMSDNAYINGNVGIGTSSPSYQLQLSTNSAAKPTSSTWTIASDIRIKKNIVEYNKGLDVIMQINPIEYDYNGLGGFKEGYGGIGIIAQELKPILPEAINSYKAKLNPTDDFETDIMNFDSHPLTFVFINAIQEQQAIIETQEQKITDLETTIQSLITRIENLENK